MTHSGSEDLIRRFLGASLTGCAFATALANARGGINYCEFGELDEQLPSFLDGLLDTSADKGCATVAIFPRIVDVTGIVELLKVLAQGDRWRVYVRKSTGSSECTLIGVEWVTRSGDLASVLGFAPLIGMPVQRRAQIVSLCLWSGARQNRHRSKPGRLISLGDMPPPDGAHEQPAYNKMRHATRNTLRAIRGSSADDVEWGEVTFVLPADVAGRFSG